MVIIIVHRYYRGTHGVIVVYDVTSGDSFVNVKRWLSEIEQNCDVVNRVLVGNKNDCPAEKKVVEKDDAQRFADQMGIRLWETSAKENANVEDVFRELTKMVLKTKRDSNAATGGGGSGTIKVQRSSESKSKCSC
ncbi:ras-related protein Rab-35-like [Sycon ciliatum]|uniref:ras-related protein Rab-35-like n=1 Tax=Sycon ciliatum TaxID=27933 RepID=UPI0031F65806